MPEKIKNRDLKKYIDKVLKKTDQLLKVMQDRERMNSGLHVLLDQEYGKHGWHDVDLRDKTVITGKELEEKLYVIKNPSLEERITREDIDDIQIDVEDLRGHNQPPKEEGVA